MSQSPESLPAASGKKILLSMGTTYAMGTFNDNFFKQAALLLAASAGLESIQGIASAMFALPFVACSAWAGWLADRMPKNRMVIWSKFMELAAMLYGVWALVDMNWAGMVAVVFLMGLQSTIFSPALNGAIPENFPPQEVPRVNALLKLATTATILLGIAAGGVVLDLSEFSAFAAFIPQGDHGFGRLAVGAVAVFIAVIGLASPLALAKALFLPGQTLPFPYWGLCIPCSMRWSAAGATRTCFSRWQGKLFSTACRPLPCCASIISASSSLVFRLPLRACFPWR